MLTTFTGLYGDRQGMPISNSYRTYNTGRPTDPAGSFAYWTDPVFDTAATPNPGHDTNPSMVYSAKPPASPSTPPLPNTITPGALGAVHPGRLQRGRGRRGEQGAREHRRGHPQGVRGELARGPAARRRHGSFKDAETADYVGIAVHCAQGSAFCADAHGREVRPDHADARPRSPTRCPTSRAATRGFQALFGHRYVAPQLGAGHPNLSHNGYQVTNAAGNLVDENGNQINGAFLTNHPGFPGFGTINASQTLAYMADMQESGVPVTYGYISDIHGNEHIPGLTACNGAPAALGSGTACYVAQAQYYNQAFAHVLPAAGRRRDHAGEHAVRHQLRRGRPRGRRQRRPGHPAHPGQLRRRHVSGTTVTPDVLVHLPGGHVRRAGRQPDRPAGDAGERHDPVHPGERLRAGVLRHRQARADRGAGPDAGTRRRLAHREQPVHGHHPADHQLPGRPDRGGHPAHGQRRPGPDADLRDVRQAGLLPLHRARRTAAAVRHARTPAFAWNHGDYAAEIDTNWAGFAGPGVAHLGLDGSAADAGPSSAGPDSGQVTVPGSGTTGTWVDETDIRPTLMYLTGLRDDYEHDGRVVTQILAGTEPARSRAPGVAALGACYKQLNSSVGQFGNGHPAGVDGGHREHQPG